MQRGIKIHLIQSFPSTISKSLIYIEVTDDNVRRKMKILVKLFLDVQYVNFSEFVYFQCSSSVVLLVFFYQFNGTTVRHYSEIDNLLTYTKMKERHPVRLSKTSTCRTFCNFFIAYILKKSIGHIFTTVYRDGPIFVSRRRN